MDGFYKNPGFGVGFGYRNNTSVFTIVIDCDKPSGQEVIDLDYLSGQITEVDNSSRRLIAFDN